MADVLNTLGLAYRAKKLVLGEEILKRISQVELIFLASDISEKSRERFEKKCFHYHIGHIDTFTGAQLSAALGKNNVKAIGVTDKGFKELLLKEKEGCHG